jgi:hypothetical protein
MITLSLFTAKNLTERGRALSILNDMAQRSPLLVPNAYEALPEIPVTRVKSAKDLFALLQQFSAEEKENYHIGFHRFGKQGTIDFSFGIQGWKDSYNHLVINFPDFDNIETREEIVRLSKEWTIQFQVNSGYMHDLLDFNMQSETNPDMFIASKVSLRGYRMKLWKREIDIERNPGHHHFINGRMFTVAWLNYFGPHMIELYGRDRIINASWFSVEEIDDHIVARLYEDPFEPHTKKKRKIQAQVRQQLRVDEIAHPLIPKGKPHVERMEINFGEYRDDNKE